MANAPLPLQSPVSTLQIKLELIITCTPTQVGASQTLTTQSGGAWVYIFTDCSNIFLIGLKMRLNSIFFYKHIRLLKHNLSNKFLRLKFSV